MMLSLTGGAYAAVKITTSDIADNAVTHGKLAKNSVWNSNLGKGAVSLNNLNAGVQAALAKAGTNGTNGSDGSAGTTGVTGATGAQGPKGATGAQGPAGDSYLAGAYYSVAYYNVGDTNGGAIATVACKSQDDTAISGGVSTDDYTKTVPVGQSFPGRMDWSKNAPFPNRLDGWIVQFASQNGSAPEKVKVYALCVPGLNLPVDQTYSEQ
jgi:hypothetical protein